MRSARTLPVAVVTVGVTLLAACQAYKPEPPPSSAAEVLVGATLTNDSFRGTSELSTPAYRADWLQWFHLRRMEARGEPVVHQLYVVNLAPDWYYLDTAIDSDSTPLPAVVIDRGVQRGVDGSPNAHDAIITREVIGVRLEPSYLATHAKAGISLRLYGKGGIYRDVSVPGYFVQGYLDTLSAHGVPLEGAASQPALTSGSR